MASRSIFRSASSGTASTGWPTIAAYSGMVSNDGDAVTRCRVGEVYTWVSERRICVEPLPSMR